MASAISSAHSGPWEVELETTWAQVMERATEAPWAKVMDRATESMWERRRAPQSALAFAQIVDARHLGSTSFELMKAVGLGHMTGGE